MTWAGDAPLDVLVVGAGTTGLTLAIQAHDHGAGVRIIDRRPAAFRPTRALLMQPRTLEVLRPLGVTDSLLSAGDASLSALLHLGNRVVPIGIDSLDLTGTPFPHLLVIAQARVEAVLTFALQERGIEVERGTTLIGLRSAGDGHVTGVLDRGGTAEEVACHFVGGCDGPNSTVRRLAGIRWVGRAYTREVVLADLDLDDSVAPDVAHVVVDRSGLLFLFALGERAAWRMLATRRSRPTEEPFGRPGPTVPQTELQELMRSAGLTARITRESGTGPVASLGRSAVAALGAPLLASLLRRRSLASRGLSTLSQLGVRYRRSPLSVQDAPRGLPLRAGDRLPDGLVVSGGRRIRLHELTSRPGIHVLLQNDATWPGDVAPGGRGPLVHVHRIDNWRGRGVVAVRPDGYIGLRSAEAGGRRVDA